MIIFKCDRCGYELTFPRIRVTVDLDRGPDDFCDYRIHGVINTDERRFSSLESVHGQFVLCSECQAEYPAVIQSAIDAATIKFIREKKE